MEAPTAPADFALTASELLDQGRKEDALELAADGVRTYPTYLGGYILLADCYAGLGYVDDARLILDEAERRFPSRAVVHERRKELERRSQAPAPPRPKPQRERREPARERKESPLRIIDLAQPTSDTRIIRSSAMRLIPGLEYTSLRFEGTRSKGERAVNVLPPAPPFRGFHEPGAYRKAGTGQPPAPDSGATDIDALANRIGRVRLTQEELEKRPPAPDPTKDRPKRSLVTETLAKIYMQQGSYDDAIEAFTSLIERYPNKADQLQPLLEECRRLREQADS